MCCCVYVIVWFAVMVDVLQAVLCEAKFFLVHLLSYNWCVHASLCWQDELCLAYELHNTI